MTGTTPPTLGMILKGFPRISETFISNEILLLERRGFDIRLLSMRQPRETFSHRSVKSIRAQVDYLPETILGHLGTLLKHNLLQAARKPRVYGAAFKTALRRFSRTRRSATFKHLLQAGYVVNRLLPERPVAHLHAHFAHSPTSVAMFTARLAGLPFSFTAHAKDIYTSDPRQLAEKIDSAKFVVTCTEYNRRYLRRLAPASRTPIYRVYHGIDLRLFNGRSEPKTAPAPPYEILTVSRLTPKKGLPTVINALRRLKAAGIPFRYTLIGDGDQRREILALIENAGLAEAVRWLGTRPHDTVVDAFARADLSVLGCEVAANGDRDGIPNVIPESMAMGVPVVATSVSAIPEIVRDGTTGLLVPPKAPEKMAAAIRRLLTDADLRGRVITNGRRMAAENFDNRKLIGLLAEIFRRETGL